MQSAGGWLCDRARAGWDVNVLVADGGDPRPLAILGATALDLDDAFLSMVKSASRVGALAVSADLLAADARVREEILRALKRGLTEVIVWGRQWPAELGRQADPVQHRVSPAARAFKSHALVAAAVSTDSVSPTETLFRVGTRIIPRAALRLIRGSLPDPAAAAQPPVASDREDDEGGEEDQEPVLDVADVVAMQHRQQEPGRQQPADVDQPVVLLGPAPFRGRHIFDVDAGVSFHLGVGHGCSSRSLKSALILA